ncbi:MAG: hypothetical protein ACI9W4_000688, partial [Rhodothermales bacterium]
HAPDRIATGGDAAIYLDWDGVQRFEGGLLTLPQGWLASDVKLVRSDGALAEVRLRRLKAATNLYQVLPAGSMAGSQTLVVRITAPESPEFGTWTFTPYRLEQAEPGSYALEPDHGLAIKAPLAANEETRTDNRALVFTERDRPLQLSPKGLPNLSASAAFTVETWLRSALAGQVVLSTWSGDEGDVYAVELILDGRGHAVLFQGMPGDHRSLRSIAPVADGGWHHVAITHDPERGWAKLLVDGVQQDSLRRITPLQSRSPAALALGGRVGQDERGSFVGDVDELRVWGLARSAAQIRSTVYRSLGQPAAGAAFFSFDEPVSRARRIGRQGPTPRLTDLSFRRDLDNISVAMDEAGVMLSWSAVVIAGDQLVVERSEDGANYDAMGSLGSELGVPAGGGQVRFNWRDDGRKTVSFYRIRQIRKSGADKISNPIKVGRNEVVEPPKLTVLEGSFPNPFNPTTSIRYSVLEGQDIAVSVWDLAGQQVRLLWSGFQEAGDYTVSFSADTLPSGTYFVRLQSPEGVQSHPILLMK